MKPPLPVQLDASRSRRAEVNHDERVYVSLPQLLLAQSEAAQLSFLPRRKVRSLLSGRHASRVRGRGLNFEEIRNYQAGDDVRMIDWKVTARTRVPHSRVFTEERDRSAILVVDQRIGMFYGTKLLMKSVAAAQVAAIAAWRILDGADRVGAIVFNDETIREFKPQRSRNHVIRILSEIAELNQQLDAGSDTQADAGALLRALEATCRTARHDCLVLIVSDMNGFDAECQRRVTELTQHNDVVISLIHDPSASGLEASRNFVVTDGQLEVEAQVQSGRERQRIEDASKGRIAEVLDLGKKLPLVAVPISAGEPVAPQLMRLLAGGGSSPITS